MCHACIYMCIYMYSIWVRKNAKTACLLITRPTAHQEIVITRGNYLRRVFSSWRKQCDVVWYSNSSKLAESIDTFLRFLNFTKNWCMWLPNDSLGYSFVLSCFHTLRHIVRVIVIVILSIYTYLTGLSFKHFLSKRRRNFINRAQYKLHLLQTYRDKIKLIIY